MSGALQFRILGPLEVHRDGRALALGGVRQRSVLALLLLHANEAVSADRLTAELWGENPPGNAAAALQAHVSRLRKLLGPAPPIETAAAGYRLRVGVDALDLLRFEVLVQAGRRRLEAGDAAMAARDLAASLDLWRGPPLADRDGQYFAQEVIGELEERRLAAVEIRIDADLELGRHTELVVELMALARQHPLRERVHAQLMLALYRAGRQAEALEVCTGLRRTLVEELGLEPSPEVRSLHEAILRHDPQLLATRAPRRSPPRHSPPRRRRSPGSRWEWSRAWLRWQGQRLSYSPARVIESCRRRPQEGRWRW
jgi:DNA-binding SARP family transcriptional activator